MTHPIPGADDFNGDDAALCQSIDALLSLDAEGALVPHGLGGHARKLLSIASLRLAAKVGTNVAISLPIDLKWDDQTRIYLSQPFTLSDIVAGAPAETPPDTCAEMRALCEYCGGTGDVHSVVGEWHGRCTCPAGAPPETPQPCDVCNGAYGHSLGCPEDDYRRDLGPSCTCPVRPCPIHP